MGVGRAEQSFKLINRWQSQFKLWSNVREHKGLQNILNIFYNKLKSFFPICSSWTAFEKHRWSLTKVLCESNDKNSHFTKFDVWVCLLLMMKDF